MEAIGGFLGMEAWVPQKILVEQDALEFPLTQTMLQTFSQIPQETIAHLRHYKSAGPMTAAKKILVLARHRGEILKPFPKIKHAINLGDFVFNPISNCHLECTYCILQSYLKNNPLLTLYTNIEDFLSGIAAAVERQPEKIFRLGTGELSDSLALDGVTALSRQWVPFFSRLPNAYLELKTKSDQTEHLWDLDHGGRTVLSWSLSPQSIIQREELKCATLAERLTAAQRAQDAGYPVGLHLDPLIYFEDWAASYEDLIQTMARQLDPSRVAWVSIGSLRFDKGLKETAMARFPKTKIFSEDFVSCPDGKFRYFKTLRIQMYQAVWGWLAQWSEDFPRYLCMEPPWMWEKVTGLPAPDPEQMEQSLLARLESLRGAYP